METKSPFAILNAINCNEHTEKKNNLTYLSWAWAWQIVKTNFPDANYTIYEDANGIPYFTDGKTCWVKTGVTINGLEHIEYLPIMDFRNQSIPLEKVTSMDMNKAIQRSLTKACARHGLGLYIYAGEDLPESEEQQMPQQTAQPSRSKSKYTPVDTSLFNRMVENYVHGVMSKSGEDYRTAWINYTHAGAEEVKVFDKAVEDYKVATGYYSMPEPEYNNL